MAKGMRSKSRRKCNTEKRKKLQKFETLRNERLYTKMSELIQHNMDVVSAPTLPKPQAPQPKVKVTELMDVDMMTTPSSGKIVKKKRGRKLKS